MRMMTASKRIPRAVVIALLCCLMRSDLFGHGGLAWLRTVTQALDADSLAL